MRPLRSALTAAVVVATAAVLAGCFTLRSTITVRPDGSGTLVETLALSGAAARMADDPEAPLGTPAALQARATALGPGVTLVGTDTAGTVRTTTYAFRDVAALRYRFPDNASESADVAAAAAAPPLYTFAFERPAAAGEPATLRVLVPEPAGGPPAPLDSAAAQQALQGLTFARILFEDARATVEVVVDGEPLAADTTAGAVRTTTLLDLAFGPLFDLIEGHPELAAQSSPPLDAVRRLAAGREGITVQPPGTLTVRFR